MSFRPYVVRQGDYLTALAHRLGFDALTVWRAPQNADLRARRPNPEMLCPGDVLHVPARPAQGAVFQAGGTRSYTARPPRVTVRLALSDGRAPLRNERYVVEGAGAPQEGRSDAEGVVVVPVPVDVPHVRVSLPDRHYVFPVAIGHLDPPDVTSGVAQRLAHLGFGGAHPQGATDGSAPDATAVRAFQRSRGLPETGVVDVGTRDALVEAHGC